MNVDLSILHLPDIALENILSFLPYDQVAKTREVCKKFNDVSSKYLTRGFIQVEKRHAAIYKKVKSSLPRRESERRTHPMARHCDILSAVETRISMLNMTFMKYIESNMCCFIPGKVIDEIERVLYLVEASSCPPRTHEFLQELRDISSMAMEHFDEHILPNLKLKPAFKLATSVIKPSRVFLVQNSVADELKKVRTQNNVHKHQLSMTSSHILQLCVKLKKQNNRLKSQSEQIREQERKIQEQNTKIQEQETIITDLKKRMEDWDQKFSDLTTEVIRTRNELQEHHPSKNTTKSTTPSLLLPPPAKLFRSNIKPRTSRILPPPASLLSFLETERKRKSSSPIEIPMKISKPLEDNSNKPCTITSSSLTTSQSPLSTITSTFKNIISTRTITKPNNEENSKVAKEPNDNEVQQKKDVSSVRRNLLGPTFIAETIENLIKSPLTKIKSRKRKSSEELDFKRF